MKNKHGKGGIATWIYHKNGDLEPPLPKSNTSQNNQTYTHESKEKIHKENQYLQRTFMEEEQLLKPIGFRALTSNIHLQTKHKNIHKEIKENVKNKENPTLRKGQKKRMYKHLQNLQRWSN